MKYKFGSFSSRFGENDVTKEKNIPKFWKINQRIGFHLFKMQMAGGVEVFVVVWSQYITLKLFRRTLEHTS